MGLKERWSAVSVTVAAWRARFALALRRWGYRVGEYCHTSPFGAVAPWLGTLVGSWIVGANTGSVAAIVIGAFIAALGCAPVAAAAAWVRIDTGRVARREARERKALQYASMQLIPKLGECTALTRPRRNRMKDEVIADTVKFLEENVYRDDPREKLRPDLTTRVVLYVLVDGNRELRSVCQAGRPDPASVFVDGDGGRGQKAFDELLHERGTFESNLTDREYVSYVSAPIASGTAVFGMISVDSTDYRKLERDDRDALEVIAAALAVFFVEAERGARIGA